MAERNRNAKLEEAWETTLTWTPGSRVSEPWKSLPSTGRRIAHVLHEPDINSGDGSVEHLNDWAAFRRTFATIGIPIRNQINRVRLDWRGSPFAIALRCADAFGEVLLHLNPGAGTAEAYSVTINRALKGGVSYPSPRPEEQLLSRIGRFTFPPVAPGVRDLVVKAVEERVGVSVDGRQMIEFDDPDVAGGVFGIGTAGELRVLSFEQDELITEEEGRERESFVNRMREFSRDLDAEQDGDIAAANVVALHGNELTWTYPDTGATAKVTSGRPGQLAGCVDAGLYGNARMLAGEFASPRITDTNGEVYSLHADQPATLRATQLALSVEAPLRSPSGRSGALALEFRLSENAIWFCTARVEGIAVSRAELVFGLDEMFTARASGSDEAGQPAKLVYGPEGLLKTEAFGPMRSGFGSAPGSSFLLADGSAGHFWKALSGHDTRFEMRRVCGAPVLVLSSERPVFRWATMWMPYHRLNLTGYRKRMVHFIRYAEVPVQEWRERPSEQEYPTDEELERYAANGTKAMVWHHTWASSNFRERDGFVVNEPEMLRAMRKAHALGISVIPYLGIVPGRHPALRYEDLATTASYDKNWDLQDFTFYSVAGRYAEFLPYMTDLWCREYGIDGFYTDGGLAILDWGRTGLSEAEAGLSLEELNDRLYSRIRRVLRRRGAGFGLENWGGAGIHLAGPWYDCRMIGEGFHEATPEAYRDVYNPLLTGMPFKMYAMDLVARNRYNIAMAAVCMTDLQMCSGNYAWGNWPDRPSDWANVRPFWAILDSIDWDHLLDAKPWWAQTLLGGEGFYGGHYTTPERAVALLVNRTEEPAAVTVSVRREQLPAALREGRMRWIYPEPGDMTALPDAFDVTLPRLHEGPVGFEIVSG